MLGGFCGVACLVFFLCFLFGVRGGSVLVVFGYV